MFYYDQVIYKNFQISYVKTFFMNLREKSRIIAHVARKSEAKIDVPRLHYKKKKHAHMGIT